jgi:hypothetical protein
MRTELKWTCLYCLESKADSEFNREHVVPEAFGKFDSNFVLLGTVCEACNSYFGSTLDLKLARQAIEGLDRYDAKVRKPDAKTKLGGTPTLSARVNNGSFADGAEVYWAPSEDQTRLSLHFFPQFGVTDGTRTVWFRVEDLPQRSDVAAHGLSNTGDISVKCVEMDADWAEKRMREQGYNTSPPEQVGATRADEEIDIRISGQIDRVLRRAVAKIACNYLAYHYPAQSRMDQTLPIRLFVRYGIPVDFEPVALSPKPLVVGATPEHAPLAHAVAVECKDGRLIGDVTLFFRFRYRILLADSFISSTPIASGHLFNVAAREIVPLTTDPTRGRPLVPPKRAGQDPES